MKKLLIVNNNLHIGGVQKALISLLWNIRDQYDVTLLLFSKIGTCCQEIPPGVKVITVKSAYRFLGITRYDLHTFRDRMGRSFFAAITRVFGRKYAIALMGLGQRKLKGYDTAISYLHNPGDRMFYGGCNDFVLKHVSAEKKIAFLHCDYLRSGANTQDNNEMYARFDRIAACSQGCADSFVAANPSFRKKVLVVPNCHRFDQIRKLAEAVPIELSRDVVNIITVARLGKEKGVERAVEAIALLGENRKKLHYYIIGDGIQRKLVQQVIDREGLSDTVTLCGTLANPYGYIQAADLLLIPSYSEAAPLVIGEAACLGTPILSTETTSAWEMIEKTGWGWVCENSEEAMSEALAYLLSEPDMLTRMKASLVENSVDNQRAVEMFEELVNVDSNSSRI